MPESRIKRTFTDDFKKQKVQLYNNGNSRTEIIREYDLTASALNNCTKTLRMGNDILKQAVLIMRRR